ncbi:wax ester/triacylglycerol synthase domain-containing protein [Streptomyces sp. NPDC057381]|uniref:wax ester/triacylglycerol synthase domain-containing protein n=1 Tax=Streptomyces sp. NPDC057381 TaxID=3346111 RepID=UPI00363C4963
MTVRSDSVPMSALDRAFSWAAAQTPSVTDTDFGALLRVRGPAPDRDTLRRIVAAGVQRAPVLAYRLQAGRWKPSIGFDIGRHLRYHPLAPGTDPTEAVPWVKRHALPENAPLWDLTVLDGYRDDEYALCYRVHHAFQDGVAMAATMEALFGTRQLPPPHTTPTLSVRPHPTPSHSTPARPWVDLAVPVRRGPVWPPGVVPPTGHRRLHVVDLDHAAIRAVARKTGSTRNQVCLAVLAGAVRDWAYDGTFPGGRHLGPKVTLPLHLRSGDAHAALGNTLGMLPITLPCALDRPAERLHHLMQQTSPQRLERHRARFRTVLRAAPFWLLRPLFARLADPRYIAAMATTIRLSPLLAVAGAPVRQAVFHPPLAPGHTVVFGMLQHGERVSVSVLIDTAVPAAGLAACLHQELAALHASPAPDSP